MAIFPFNSFVIDINKSLFFHLLIFNDMSTIYFSLDNDTIKLHCSLDTRRCTVSIKNVTENHIGLWHVRMASVRNKDAKKYLTLEVHNTTVIDDGKSRTIYNVY